MNKDDIILNNEKLGIRTVFLNENNGLLGYTDNGIIYLNDFYDEDLELINKHEVLHLFEDSKQFLDAKKLIIEMLGEKELNRIRNEYYLKYSGLYTDEEINNGILDNEITIDIIIGNGKFALPINDYIHNAYETIVSKKEEVKLTNEGRKYLSLNVSRNTSNRYSGLSKWDLLFSERYYEGKEKPTGEKRYDQISGDAMRACDSLLYENYYNDFFIKTDDNPYLKRRLKEIIATYEANGETEQLEIVLSNEERALDNLSKEYSTNLYGQFLSLSKLLQNSSYEDSFKYLILNEALTKTYRYEKGNRIVDKREKGKTILPFMLINEFILKEIHDNIDKYHNFTDLYFDSLDKYNNEFLKSRNVNFNQSELGSWIKFNRGQEGTSSFIKDSQDLGNLIRDTPWCTRKSPESQLKEGDFYVFVDNFGKPRIAVQLKGDYVNEVRGIKGEGDQEIQSEYRQIAIDFLKDNISLGGASVWLEKEERNQILEEFLTKIRKKDLTEKDIEILVSVLEKYETNVHGQINSNERKIIKEIANDKEIRDKLANVSGIGDKVSNLIEEIERNYRILEYCKKIEEGTLKVDDCKYLYSDITYEFRKYEYEENKIRLIEVINSKDNVFRQMMANKYKCEPKEIYIGSLVNNRIPLENGVCPLKVILGDVNFSNLRNMKLSNVEYIKGSLTITWGKNIDLSSLKKVDSMVDMVDNEFINMRSLEIINGDVKIDLFSNSNLESIKVINGDAYFNFFCCIDNYENLEAVFGNLNVSHMARKMDKLKFVQGVINWDKLCKIEELPSLEQCGGFSGPIPDKIESMFTYDEENDCYLRNVLKK